ncbi:MAG: DNA alkylation repair protein [Candidatus Omnitrophica bacterium]|nr:DNA alkylation repair protein [Candidatus Omnitrophota bacterium]
MSTRLAELRRELKSLASPDKAKVLSGFFKTGKGQYSDGDIFLGITVPAQRLVAKAFKDISLKDLGTLIQSPYHEERFVTLLILIEQFKEAASAERDAIYTFYLENTAFINNWDLVDFSAYNIVGAYLDGKSFPILKKLAHSTNIWERRIAIVSTFHDIRARRSKPTFKIAEILLHDKHDLIHKATGWMLREVGKRVSMPQLETFLKRWYTSMPRTMLRYAIERLPKSRRKAYLQGDT